MGDGVYDFFDDPVPWKALEEPETVSETPEFDTSGEEFFPELYADVRRVPVEEEEYPDLEVTYSMFGDEKGFDQVYSQASDWLEMPGGMIETFKLYPVNVS